MATFLELFDITNLKEPGSGEVRDKTTVACVITGITINDGNDTNIHFDSEVSAHERRIQWANAIFQDPRREGQVAFNAVVAANQGFTVSQIISATDSKILSNVEAIADTLAARFSAIT